MKSPSPLFLMTSVLAAIRRAVLPGAAATEVQQQPFHFQANQTSASMSRAPVVCISHGGGPMPILGDPEHDKIVKSLRERVPDILKLGTPEQPRAIVLVTAHWSERNPTISNAQKHSLLYDYYGFPPESYKLKYDAPGAPDVANEVAEALKAEGLKPEFDEDRGWDHGVFVPMLLINPKADVPIVQMSVLRSENPADHYRMGRALSKLRDSNVAILGSGFPSIHNLRAMFSGMTHDPSFKSRNSAWSRAVNEAVKEEKVEERQKKLEEWRKFPGAYDMHPRGGAEHFLPLIVCAGAAGEGQGKTYSDKFMGLDMYSYYWK
ncbi:Extradiol ring-cleavage dioxygenase class III enzyme subunit B [Neofusicoccum parvum]|uniref:Extradiol ring-cleavage dioxygenase class III enzyme subunit B n=2 Tax=Neofusicoccum parvum TaxID=310453 RepID=A0ACB5RX41_9PEZI|nr:putative extradiol ring-cleavage dioxygenase protein [Neofusicoccum parvum UCRNP2]GME25117.1 Extradiol ring-cleavage dioxygenase class III enzyme subunit B [Neofusicoccum parvum]GME58535.1 Extradiol ring-cleavage dioxygenase class III enzyme subunit B [Neofusicoccum parvum]